MKLRCLLPLLAAALVARGDNEIGFVEKFALASDREKVLTELVPGTEDYYFYHALHFQNTKQAAKLTTILDQWKQRVKESPRRKIIENREALLAYDADPQRTLTFLKDFFKLQFNHVQERPDAKPDLPTTLDAALIARAKFQEIALRDDDLGKCSLGALEQLVADKVALRPPQRRALLAKMVRPDVPGLLDLIIADLNLPESGGFGEFPIHRQLLPEQLDALVKAIPRLASEQAMVLTRVRKLAPNADEDADFDAAAREAWLERLWDYVKTLPASHNSLKAAVLYRRLDHDRKKGVYDAARFAEYLKLPRQTNYAAVKWLETLRARETTWADLNASFAEAGLTFPPIRSDEPLVREFFLALFAAQPEKSWEPYAEWVRDTWLKPVFAEAMIVSGIGDAEKWASLLTPTAYQRLKDRVDLDFVATNPPFLAPGDDVALDVWVKNAPKLIVKVYELNALNYFLTQRRQLNTDLPLDGLIANAETTHEYTEPPTRRVRRTFKFPELKGRRGAWMIELIGGGKSSRALVRKGQWDLVQQTGPAGDLLTVLDETYTPVKDAAIWLDGRKFTPDQKTGTTTVPFTAQPGRRPVILADATGTFATFTEFEHHAEEYRLDAQFHIEREQLLAGKEATLAIRAALRLHESELPLTLLQDAKLTITTITHDGIETTRVVKDLKLDAARVLTVPIPIPNRLATLIVKLGGWVEQLSKGGERVNLEAFKTEWANRIDLSEATFCGHLNKFGENYVFELLGKNAEPIADRQVVFDFKHRDFDHTLTVPLRSDERGRVTLGSLAGIARVRAKLPNALVDEFDLHDFERTKNDTIHVTAGQPFEVPVEGVMEPGTFTLYEVRSETLAADRTKNIVILPMGPDIKKADGAFEPGLRLPSIPFEGGLPAGDYQLFIHRENRVVNIKVTNGTARNGWAFGKARHLQLSSAKPLTIPRLETQPNELVIYLGNANPFTRVHVAATRRISNDTELFHLAAFTRMSSASEVPAGLPNLYAEGRDIGDEYRYILERRYAQKFPGNMLSKPGLLLNPWEKRSTDQVALDQTAMQQPQSTAGERARKAAPAAAAGGISGLAPIPDTVTHTPNLDYLATIAPVFYNLVPDKDGIVRIDRRLLGDRQHVQVYAEDLREAVWRSFALPEADTKLRDLRLARNLDPAKAFSEKNDVSLLGTGQSLVLADVLTSELETYDTLGSIFALLQTLSRNDTLPKFAWVLDWPRLKDEEKRAKYSEFACHELNFFLARKDGDFFAKVVKPYLANKKDKTFLDEYLLGADLKRYLEPWQFARLNVVERALLGSRLPGEGANVARHLRELWEMLPPNPDEQARLFETALRGRAMEGDANEFGTAKQAAELAAVIPAPDDAASKNAARPMAAAPAAAAQSLPGMMAGRAGDTRRGGKEITALGLELDAKDKLEVAEKLAQLRDESETRLRSEVAGREVLRRQLSASEAGDFDRGFSNHTDFYFADADGVAQQRGAAKAQAYYRKLGATKEWAENNYYRLPLEQQGADLITVNAFWRDFAAWLAEGAKAPFLSAHVAEAHRNFSEILLALAVLDLPFDAPKHETKSEGGSFTFKASGPVIAYHKQIQPAAPAAPAAVKSELLLSQNFFRAGDRYRNEGNEKFDKYVTDEFLAGAVYGANLVVTNPASAPAKLDLLTQIPRGALPVRGSKATGSQHVRLEPFSTQKIEYYFYFPRPAADGAKFPHYPVNAAIAGATVAAAKPFAFNVVGKLTQVDKASWDYVSQYSSDAEALAFLEQNNLERLDLARVAWRCRQSIDFFRKLIALLEKRHRFDPLIYSYALHHHEFAPLREWLRHRDDLLSHCGAWLDTRLVRLDPIEKRGLEQLEYSPLVNQRAHRLGVQLRIANNVVLAQYRHLLDGLCYKPMLEAADQMRVVTFLFTQDRVEEALARFKTVSADALPARIQHDYFRCYAAFYEADLATARGIANQYADHPVTRWRTLFGDVLTQLDEIEGKAVVKKAGDGPDRERETADAASAQPTFDFKVENRTLALTWKNLHSVTINYYRIDPEFSFSSNPFVSEDAGRLAIIKPTQTAQLPLPAGKDALDVPLPAEFAKANVLVEVVGAGQRKAQAYHANTLKLTLAENYGRLDVRDATADKPVAKAYVKVYARLANGTVRFFKDGYTDLRGKFDYASLNSSETPAPPQPMPRGAAPGGSLDTQMLRPGELDSVARLSILVLSEANGALVREVAPPRE
jgi:hypothetical protein